MYDQIEDVSLPTIGTAAGLLAFFLFGALYAATGAPSALVAGCGGGLLLLGVSLAAARQDD
ncbi:MAG TPA: hypothetical protein VGB08_08505 [Allosphingosinicella sp.]|jgi:hypothetical protein